MNFLYEDTMRFYIKTGSMPLLDMGYLRQYHSPSRFGAPDKQWESASQQPEK
jgi:hypothetical protein